MLLDAVVGILTWINANPIILLGLIFCRTIVSVWWIQLATDERKEEIRKWLDQRPFSKRVSKGRRHGKRG